MLLGRPQFLWLLLAVPAAALGYALYFRARRRLLARLGSSPMIQRMAEGVSLPRKVMRAVMTVAALGLMAGALAEPQAGGVPVVVRERGLDLVVALDFSKSMLARDVYPSRLERAKRELERLIDSLAGDRVGLVAFAGETLAYPPTTDYEAVKLFWRDMSPWDLPVGGTAIGRALRSATETLVRLRAQAAAGRTGDGDGDGDSGEGEVADRAQVILLLTDGEDTESEPMEAAQEASKLGIRVYTVGIGSRSGELIPEFDQTGEVTGYVKDSDGKYVTSRLGEEMLAGIARKTGGEYLHADARRFGVEQIQAALAGLKRTENEARKVRDPGQIYALALLPAFLLLVGEAAASDRRRARKTS
jgi:Ca-activated chloride channel homolog